MKKIYVTESQMVEAFGMGLSYFDGASNIPQVKADSEISVNGNLSGETEVTMDKINNRRSPRTYFGSRKTPNTIIKCSCLKKKALTESNQDLVNDVYEIPNELYQLLLQNYNSVNGKKNIDGIMRLKNLLNDRTISYKEMYRLKNHFENTPKQNSDYNLLGGEKMKRWIEQQLKTATAISKNTKDVKHMMGMENAYISKHQKNSKNGQAHTTKKNNVTFNYEKNIENN